MELYGLPKVEAQGFLQRDAEFRKINEQGGFLKFTIRCSGDEIVVGGRRRMSYYTVDRWLASDNNLLADLVKDAPVRVTGTWKISKGKQGTIFNSIDAEKIVILNQKPVANIDITFTTKQPEE